LNAHRPAYPLQVVQSGEVDEYIIARDVEVASNAFNSAQVVQIRDAGALNGYVTAYLGTVWVGACKIVNL